MPFHTISRSFIVGLALNLIGCAHLPLRPVGPNSQVQGQPALTTAIVVPRAFTFRPGLVTNTLPDGRYVPTMEDDVGIYFRAPSSLFIGDVVGYGVYEGGLYYNRTSPNEIYEYIVVQNRSTPLPLRLPHSFVYHFTHE